MRICILIALIFSISFVQAQTLPFIKAGSYHTNLFDQGGSRAAVYDRNSELIYSVNRQTTALEIFEPSDLTKIHKIKTVDLTSYIEKVNSVASYLGLVAVSGEGVSPQLTGKVLFFDKNGNYQNQISVGPKPDMLTFTPNGSFLLVANEGEPSDDYLNDPPGSITIMNMGFGVINIPASAIMTVDFDTLNSMMLDPHIKLDGNNGQQTSAQDLEPEYIVSDPTSTKAYVSLQENNALMIIDLYSASIDTVFSFGYSDHSQAGFGLDGSDESQTINISTYDRLFGMYQPGGMAVFSESGEPYLLTANEGEARDYSAYSEVGTVGSTPLHPGKFLDVIDIQQSQNIGNLEITTALGDMDGDGLHDSIISFGSRSFSVRDSAGQLIWDSGDDFEQIIATAYGSNFNSSNISNSSFKSRSIKRGPEPSAVTVGDVDGKRYAFIALEQMGGIMIYDIDDPTQPQFVQYELNRDFTVSETDREAGDLGTNTIQFIPANQNFTGVALLLTSNEVSGNISVYKMGQGAGVKEQLAVPVQNFYPNPSAGKVFTDQAGNFKVYDSSGKFIIEVDDEQVIDLSNFKPGLYLIKNSEGQAVRVIRN